MFERYTERARRVLFFARYQASQAGSLAIAPEHLLLGLIREQRTVVSGVLSRLGVSAESIRTAIEAIEKVKQDVGPTVVEIPFTPEVKEILKLAADEADRLGHAHIGAEHLLLAVVREGRSAAASILAERGFHLDQMRDAVRDTPEDTIDAADRPIPSDVSSSIPVRPTEFRKPDLQPSYTVTLSPTPGDRPPGTRTSSGRDFWVASGVELRDIMARVYGIGESLIFLPPSVDARARYDVTLVLPQAERTAVIQRLIQQAIERHFSIETSLEPRPLEVYVLTDERPHEGSGFGAVGIPGQPSPQLMDQFSQIVKGFGALRASGTTEAYVLKETDLSSEMLAALQRQMGVTVKQASREVLALVAREKA